MHAGTHAHARTHTSTRTQTPRHWPASSRRLRPKRVCDGWTFFLSLLSLAHFFFFLPHINLPSSLNLHRNAHTHTDMHTGWGTELALFVWECQPLLSRQLKPRTCRGTGRSSAEMTLHLLTSSSVLIDQFKSIETLCKQNKAFHFKASADVEEGNRTNCFVFFQKFKLHAER